jgi:hypothetical protein
MAVDVTYRSESSRKRSIARSGDGAGYRADSYPIGPSEQLGEDFPGSCVRLHRTTMRKIRTNLAAERNVRKLLVA